MQPATDMPRPAVPPMAAVDDLVIASTVEEVLQGYARRAVFRGFAAGPLQGSRQTYKILWHYGRVNPLLLDLERRTLTFEALLPQVSRQDPMVAELKVFVRAFASREVPEHRRIDPKLGRLKVRAVRGALTLQMDVLGGDYDYCVRKLVHVTHEIFLVFLREGPYFEYRCAALGLDPDAWG
jgi:hypothetical protein